MAGPASGPPWALQESAVGYLRGEKSSSISDIGAPLKDRKMIGNNSSYLFNGEGSLSTEYPEARNWMNYFT